MEEDEDEDEPVLETAGGVNWPLLSEPVLSRAGEDFFLGGRALALLPLCCCWRHLALRFLNHTYKPENSSQELATVHTNNLSITYGKDTPRPCWEYIMEENWGLLAIKVHFHPGPLARTSQGSNFIPGRRL